MVYLTAAVWIVLLFTVSIGAAVYAVVISGRGGEDRNGAETRLAALAGGRVARGVGRGILDGGQVNVQDVGVDLLMRPNPAGGCGFDTWFSRSKVSDGPSLCYSVGQRERGSGRPACLP